MELCEKLLDDIITVKKEIDLYTAKIQFKELR